MFITHIMKDSEQSSNQMNTSKLLNNYSHIKTGFLVYYFVSVSLSEYAFDVIELYISTYSVIGGP